MANRAGVSEVERMRTSRHKSVETSAAYMSRSGGTEIEKFKAFGIVPESGGTSTPPGTSTSTPPTVPLKTPALITPKVDTTPTTTTTIIPTVPTSPTTTQQNCIPKNTNLVLSLRGGGPSPENENTKKDTELLLEENGDDADFPHTQLALAECDNDIKKLEESLVPKKCSREAVSNSVRVLEMAKKVRDMTQLVKELNEKVLQYEDIIYNQGMADCDRLLNIAGRKRSYNGTNEYFSPGNSYGSNCAYRTVPRANLYKRPYGG